MTISDVLQRNVEEVLPSKKGLEQLAKGRKIRLYLGVDPTSPYMHLGHAVVLRKLREFQELGHEVVLLFGTFTAQIGDPSGRDKAREPLSEKEIKRNMATYKKQAGKILDLARITIQRNGDWLSRLKPRDFLKISSFFTAAQLLERDMFQNRIKKGGEVWMNELLYPLMQGYDSVAMDVDLEVGGTDQTFNMLVGRRLQKAYRNKEKFVLTVPLLLGLDGRKMSKSYGNTVNILDVPQDMYGKIMSMKDELIPHYFEFCADVSPKEAEGLAPRDAKAKLAKQIVAMYHGEKAAEKAQQEFERVFRKKQAPSTIKSAEVSGKSVKLSDLLVQVGLADSKSEARRLVLQKGVKVEEIVQEDPERVIRVKKGMVVQKGKREFRKIK
ncbi:MAG TPA: tyrosine--tRNA ligase [Candidatus Paceibacterota bacterium]